MKNFYILFCLSIFLNQFAFSQSIRKNHLEMTATEKVNLVNGLYQLRLGPDLFDDLAIFHGDFANFDNTATPTALDIHLNLPDEPERDIFLPWHRRQIFEIEQALQDINPNISIPYWDTSTDQSINSSLWDQNFMGQFDLDWNLGRVFGNPAFLPTPAHIIDVQSETVFLTYANRLEREEAHTGGHRWVRGAMQTSFSPRDPVFYLHHANVDRLWNNWQEANGTSSYIATSMLRYDGTYVFNGQTLPLVNPNDILEAKDLGVFYAENQLAELEDYTVSNTYNAQENFYYQFTIQAGNNFVVPSGTDCKFESVNEIVLQPGFEVASGGNFIGTIDAQPANRSASKQPIEIVRNQIPFSERELEDIFINQSIDGLDTAVSVISSFPNPFSNKITVTLDKELPNGRIIIYNMMGVQVKNESAADKKQIEIINLFGLPTGAYVLQVVDGNNKVLIARRLIKMQ